MEKLEFNNINIKLGNKQLYKDFNIFFEQKTITSFIAPSGSGKTTLLNYLAKQHIEISYLFQENRLLPWCSLQKNISLPLENLFPKKQALEIADSFLDQVELLDRKKELPPNLSGGERQRVSLARAFAFPSRLLLMDEAFQSQDIALKIKLMTLFENLQKQKNRTVFFVTHDVKEALVLSDRVIVASGEPMNILLDKTITQDRTKSIATRYIDFNAHQTEQEIIKLLVK